MPTRNFRHATINIESSVCSSSTTAALYLEARSPLDANAAQQHDNRVRLGRHEPHEEQIARPAVVALQNRFAQRGIGVQADLRR